RSRRRAGSASARNTSSTRPVKVTPESPVKQSTPSMRRPIGLGRSRCPAHRLSTHQAEPIGSDMSADIVVIGTGYVGLTTAACLAHLGHRVIGADIDERRVEQLSRAEIPIVEDGLEEIVKEGLANGN